MQGQNHIKFTSSPVVKLLDARTLIDLQCSFMTPTYAPSVHTNTILYNTQGQGQGRAVV